MIDRLCADPGTLLQEILQAIGDNKESTTLSGSSFTLE